jgi:hypothetical protein
MWVGIVLFRIYIICGLLQTLMNRGIPKEAGNFPRSRATCNLNSQEEPCSNFKRLIVRSVSM